MPAPTASASARRYSVRATSPRRLRKQRRISGLPCTRYLRKSSFHPPRSLEEHEGARRKRRNREWNCRSFSVAVNVDTAPDSSMPFRFSCLFLSFFVLLRVLRGFVVD